MWIDHDFRLPENLVTHPRFGVEVIPSGFDIPHPAIIGSSGRSDTSHLTTFPVSATPADTARQRFTVFPILYYVDMLLVCRGCRRPYLFFAREQQYWYEELGFSVDARCVDCTDCRRSEHRRRQRAERYAQLIRKDDRDDAELATLVEDAVHLFRAGVMRRQERLGRLKNLALDRIPEAACTGEILGLIAEIRGGGMVPRPGRPEDAVGPAPGPSRVHRPRLLALSWEPLYLIFYNLASIMAQDGEAHGRIRSQFSSYIAVGQWADAVRDAIEDALAGRPVRSVKPPPL